MLCEKMEYVEWGKLEYVQWEKLEICTIVMVLVCEASSFFYYWVYLIVKETQI